MANLSAIPYCGAVCLVSSLSSAACASTDAACLCASTAYNQVVEACVLGNCTIREGLLVKNATTTACGDPQESRDVQIIIVSVVTIFLHFAFFALRMLAKIKKLVPWGRDDTVTVVAYAIMIPWVVLSHVTGHERLGRNIWTLTPDQIDGFLFYFFTCEVLYAPIVFLTKSSIIFMYMRIFPGKPFRIVSWVTQGIILASLVTFFIADCLQCQPLSFFWTYWDGQHKGTCVDLIALAKANAWINIVLEVWMVIMPATQVWGLQMTARKRIQVMFMFGFGVFIIGVSIIRMQFLSQFATTQNPTVDFFSLSISTTVELTASFMVACMPSARAFALHYWPKVISTMSSGKSRDKPVGSPTGSSDGSTFPNAHSRAMERNRVTITSSVRKFKRLSDSSHDWYGGGSLYDEPRLSPPLSSRMEKKADVSETYVVERQAGSGEIVVQQDVTIEYSDKGNFF